MPMQNGRKAEDIIIFFVYHSTLAFNSITQYSMNMKFKAPLKQPTKNDGYELVWP